jgi:homocysteine S-methyltransferase
MLEDAMPKYRADLPLLADRLFLTDGGLETTLIFHDGLALPHFAAVDLLRTPKGMQVLRRYYARHAAIADANGIGFILESPTWRASRDWGDRLGYAPGEMARLNRRAIDLMVELRDAFESPGSPMVISGCLGPRGDGYDPGRRMGEAEAETYHREQVDLFAASEADMVAAFTLNYVEEAIGIARAARRANMPAAISFTLETDGRLPGGNSLADAIVAVDAATGAAPLYYMINCAHPSHFAHVLAEGGAWLSRLRGLRANASRRSHAELDAAPELDAGDPIELGAAYRELRRRLPGLTILGGCCGTDHRHVQAICAACVAPADLPRLEAAE